jgi:tetratricopeptide (TPR) repeat protein
MGRFDEAFDELKKAQKLDPLSLWIKADAASIFYMAKQYDKAIKQCKDIIKKDLDFPLAYLWLGSSYVEKEMYEEAIKVGEIFANLTGNSPLALALLGRCYAGVGEREEALMILDRLEEISKERYVSPSITAMIYIGLDDKDRVFENLEKAYEEKDFALASIKVNPFFNILSSDPRFAELLKKIGF